MELKNLTSIRIHFRKTILLSTCNYELRAYEKFRNNQATAIKLIKSMQINLKNYLFFNNLSFLNYRDAIEIYNKEFCNSGNTPSDKVNDVTKIILLFFPHILRSANLHSQIIESSTLNFENLQFEDKTQIQLQSDIKDFFLHYENLKKNKGFVFHRKEMLFYLESFLISYTAFETRMMKDEEIKDMFLLHYFRPFLKPEDYFKKLSNDV